MKHLHVKLYSAYGTLSISSSKMPVGSGKHLVPIHALATNPIDMNTRELKGAAADEYSTLLTDGVHTVDIGSSRVHNVC